MMRGWHYLPSKVGKILTLIEDEENALAFIHVQPYYATLFLRPLSINLENVCIAMDKEAGLKKSDRRLLTDLCQYWVLVEVEYNSFIDGALYIASPDSDQVADFIQKLREVCNGHIIDCYFSESIKKTGVDKRNCKLQIH